ncbi:Trk system potassium transporter TrkA [Faecalibacillus faecis]|uniref:Trk system potassium transporter TrkA n=1 Tax=Faecalibacillus faecis TaxID=1982628 RepID=UPI000E4E909F|nr:Trk system potassium transporter TrkA [Faecalibacillus faecis]RGT59784.1 Trk system potassium transporter TrkA [Coprobacillus sp. AF18-40]RGT85551.1 Trk system potassium transporter TrkA [Coprobacillus sp. AF18-15LB]
MKIIVLGAGKVGKTLIKHMSNEDHDIIVVDQNATKVEEVVNQFDVIGVVGNGGSYDILMEAGAQDANLIICVTASDELNILAGLMAKKMGTRHTIARVRNPDYSSQRDFMRNQLGFSMIVNPELEAASEIRRVLSFPSAVKVDTFSRGKVELAEFFVEEHSRLNGVELSQLHKITKTNILVCAVSHNEDVIIPDGNYAIKPGDHLYITGTHRDLSRFCLDIGVITTRIKNVIIVGGGKIAYYLSKQLSTQGIKVKIIEKDKNRCQVLAEKLPYVTIIHGDGSDDELLNEEGIENTDAVLALTGLDEENIVLSLSAKSLYHKKTIAKVTRMNYAGLSDVLKVDSIVAPKKIVASQIIRYVRAKMNKDNDSSVKTLYKIVDGEVEAIEFKVTEQFKYLHKTLNEMKIKEHVLVAAIIRENEVIVPKGNTTMELNDYVIIVSRGEIMKSLNDILRG